MGRKFLLDEQLIMAIGDYLVGRPYIEVKDLIKSLEALKEYKEEKKEELLPTESIPSST